MNEVFLTPHFLLSEFTTSQTAARKGIDNEPGIEEKLHLRELAKVLEVVRKVLGNRAITITSGYRSPELNAAVGGAKDSDHMLGLAADFICPAYGSPREIAIALAHSTLPFRQVILEYDRWVHLSIPRPGEEPKHEVLTIRSGTGYMKGIV